MAIAYFFKRYLKRLGGRIRRYIDQAGAVTATTIEQVEIARPGEES